MSAVILFVRNLKSPRKRASGQIVFSPFFCCCVCVFVAHGNVITVCVLFYVFIPFCFEQPFSDGVVSNFVCERENAI